jgi:hypothetical protein
MKSTLCRLAILALLSLPAIAEEGGLYNPFVCEPSELPDSFFLDKRYLRLPGNRSYPKISADTKTIQIDRKNKTIKVWLIYLASEQGRQQMKKVHSDNSSHYDLNHYGYVKYLTMINYRTMQEKAIYSAYYNCDGSIIDSRDDNAPWEHIVSGSAMDSTTESIMEKYNLK